MKKLGVLSGVLILQCISSIAVAKVEPLPVKTKFTIKSAAPLEQLWSGLSEKEKQLAFHLQNAAREGRTLLFYQSHRHALAIKQMLETALSPANFETTKRFFGRKNRAAFKEFMLYAAQFQDQGGPYAASNSKYILKKVRPGQVNWLAKHFGPNSLSAKARREIVHLMTNPDYEVIRRPEQQGGEDLILTGGNIYKKGLTGDEVKSAVAQGLKIDLNCQLLKDVLTGKVVCKKMTVFTPGIVGRSLVRTVMELRKALPYATTDLQKEEIEYLIRYFTFGEQEDFRQASIAWVKDGLHSKIDFIMGFIEVYDDYLGNVGSWESYVQILDPETTRVSQALAKNAQYFEDKMPYDWKKEFPADYAPPALMVYYFQEIAGMRSGGYNLPNFDDIRRDVGFKNIIRLPLPGESEKPENKAMLKELFQAFGPANKVELMLQHQEKARRVLVLLHEIIGHGSGTYDPTKYGEKEDPISVLASVGGSALEEQRADLSALVFAGDSKLVDVGIYKDQGEALAVRNAMYDIYLVDFLKWLSRQRSFSEAHLRGHWLLINHLLKGGAIAWASPSGEGDVNVDTQVLVVKDYDKFWSVSEALLRQLQDIKANKKSEDLANLMKTFAPLEEASSPWAQSIVKRGADLLINAGFYEQSWEVDPNLKFHSVGNVDLPSLVQSWN